MTSLVSATRLQQVTVLVCCSCVYSVRRDRALFGDPFGYAHDLLDHDRLGITTGFHGGPTTGIARSCRRDHHADGTQGLEKAANQHFFFLS